MSKVSVPVTPRAERERPTHLMTDSELRKEYVHLRKTNAIFSEAFATLHGEINALCEESVRFQQSTEIEEEKLANQLLRRLQREELQKQRYHSLICEEEGARRKIMEQISEVRAEKAKLESQVAQEQESLMLEVQKKLVEVVNKKNEVERELLRERHRYLDVLLTQLTFLKQSSLPETKINLSLASDSNKEDTQSKSGETVPPSSCEFADGDKPLVALSAITTNAHDAVNRLERQLNHLLSEHAKAVEASATNESLCTELGKGLEKIQQAAFLDRARALRLREELMEAKKRLFDVKQHMQGQTASFTSDDSSGLPTPTLGYAKRITRPDRAREIFWSLHERPRSFSHPSCDASDFTDETHPSPLVSSTAKPSFQKQEAVEDEEQSSP